MGKGKGARDWSGVPILDLIDRELKLNPELKDGMSAYVSAYQEWKRNGDGEAFLDALLDHAERQYRTAGQPLAKFYTFSDGSANILFDDTRERVAMAWGVTRQVAPISRDNAYHAGYPTAGKNMDKGHAWSHAQGGREGGPNYFRQARRLNQARSFNGKLWRKIENYLASNAGLSAFVRLIYAKGNGGEVPDKVEYAILSGDGQFRAVIFPNR